MPKQSITPYTEYTFRYDYKDDAIVEKIKNYIIREIPKYAIFDEISEKTEKPHLQGKIGKALSLDQLRKHFHKEFPGVFCKSNYSITLIQDPSHWDSYICKDGKVLCNNIFSQEFIDAQVHIREVNKIEHQLKKEKNVKKMASTSFTQQVFNEFKNSNPIEMNHIKCGLDYCASDTDILYYDKACEKLLGFLLKRLGNIVKVFDDVVLQRMYTGIKNAILNEGQDFNPILVSQYKKRIQL